MQRSSGVPLFLFNVLGVVHIAAASPLKPGDALNYKYTTAWIEPVSLSTPAAMIKMYKMVPRPESYSLTFTVSVDRVDPDGTAHAIISPHLGNMHIRGWSFTDFEGTVMPDGQIVPKFDLTMIKGSGIDQTSSKINPGYHPQTPAESVNFSAFSFSRRLLVLNDVALGAGQKKSFKDGDAWRIVIPDKNNEIVNFDYQGMESHQGHDVVSLGFTTTRTTQNGVGPIAGTARYDLQRNVVTMMHFVGDDDTPLGVRTQTVDIALK